MRSALGVLLSAAVLGCQFDERFLEDVSVPAAVLLANDSEQAIVVDAFYSAPDAPSVFSLKGGELEVGGETVLRVPEQLYEAIIARGFVLEGKCADGERWRRDGAAGSLRLAIDPRVMKVRISIARCAP